MWSPARPPLDVYLVGEIMKIEYLYEEIEDFERERYCEGLTLSFQP